MTSLTTYARPILRHILPAPARSLLWRAKLGGVRLIAASRCRLVHLVHLVRFRQRCSASGPAIDYLRIDNRMPNSGPVPMTQQFKSSRELVNAFDGAMRRRQDNEAFSGFAPDDAVYDPESQAHEFWSNVRLAGFLADFGYRRYAWPTILELGCGSAHLFRLLRRYGVFDYVGIDGNPYFVTLNRQIRDHAEHFRALNLQEELRLCDGARPLLFDIVCSFEVAEHIREESIDNFLRTIWNHMHRESTAFLTASLQADLDVHVLVRDRDWWLRRLNKCGLVPIVNSAELCRKVAERHPWNWNAANTNVFVLRAAGQREKET